MISKTGITIVDFYAPWCAPCKMMLPILESIEGVKLIKINVDEEENKEIVERAEVGSIPHIEIYKDGELIKKHIGVISKDQIESLIK